MSVVWATLGDQAVLVECGDESTAQAWAAAARRLTPPWQLDTVLAYRSVAVFFDLEHTTAAEVRHRWQALAPVAAPPPPPCTHVIPCCYELGPDLAAVAALCRLSPAEVIAAHSGRDYSIFAIGFSPGFPYLGYLDERIAGVPRRAEPRVRVEPGSVGITGRQTAIYPQATPGGWNLIGQTPLVIADLLTGFFPLRAGDRLRFVPISLAEFQTLRGQRLGLSDPPAATPAIPDPKHP